MSSWITFHPQWFLSEYDSIIRRYPNFQVCEGLLHKGILCFFGELVVRPPGGTKRQPVVLAFPEATPYVFPTVTPIASMPEFDGEGNVKEKGRPIYFDRLHQMPSGGLCLFQQETRAIAGGESIRAVDVLKRAEQWLLGHYTGRWPPDSHRSELENHFIRSGDILLGERLFEEDLTGYGEFYAVRDVNRVLMNRSNDMPPLLVTSILDRTSGIAAVQDARACLTPIFPWLENDFWKPDQLSELDEKQRSDNYWNVAISRGYWWTLKAEPSPFRDGSGLLRELEGVAPGGDAWKMVSDVMTSSIATEFQHLIGLKYPGRDGNLAWLVVQLEVTPAQHTSGGILLAANDRAKRERFAKGIVSCYRSHAVRSSDLQLRNQTVVAPEVRQRTIALVGLGALGSKVAELLAQAGVGKFRLCDFDCLTVGNVARHVGGLHEFGSPKWRVVARRIQEINSFAIIEKVLAESVNSRPDMFRDFCKGADLVVSTIADEGAEAGINQIAVTEGLTVLYGRAMRRGSMGRAFLVRPGRDACKTCLSQYANDLKTGRAAKWISVAESEHESILHECGRPVIPASAIDLSFVAGLIARKALDVLEGKDDDKNHLVWSRDGAPDVDKRLLKPFSVVETAFAQLNECPVCQHPPVRSVEIPNAIHAEIAKQVEASQTTETGGVLIGYLDGRKAIVTRTTGPGPKAVRTATRLERDVEYVQQQVELALRELGPKGLYIGEWHSHLEPDPAPSGQDIRSMIGIAIAPNYATHCPVMMIAGLDVKQTKFTMFKAWSFPMKGQARRIPIALIDSTRPTQPKDKLGTNRTRAAFTAPRKKKAPTVPKDPKGRRGNRPDADQQQPGD